jgi:hypothetical protein
MCLKFGTFYPRQHILGLFIFKDYKEQINSHSAVGIVNPRGFPFLLQTEVQGLILRPGRHVANVTCPCLHVLKSNTVTLEDIFPSYNRSYIIFQFIFILYCLLLLLLFLLLLCLLTFWH